LDAIARTSSSRDTVLVFISGHGESGTYFFLTSDSDRAHFRRTALSGDDLKDIVSTIAGKVIFFSGACHFGALVPGTRSIVPTFDRLVNDFISADTGIIVCTSCVTGKHTS
jgi:Caspase domain